jgi:hypothetical protein
LLDLWLTLDYQAWGIQEINGERRYARNVKFTGPKGEDVEALLVYDYRTCFHLGSPQRMGMNSIACRGSCLSAAVGSSVIQVYVFQKAASTVILFLGSAIRYQLLACYKIVS